MNAIVDHKNNATGLEIRELTPNIGAKVLGVTLGGDLSKETVQAIRSAILKHKVIFFRGQQHLDEDGQQAFGNLLGKIFTNDVLHHQEILP